MFFNISDKIVLDVLRTVIDPATGQDIVSSGMVDGLQNGRGEISFLMVVDPSRGPELEALRRQAEIAVSRIRGVRKATAILTAEREPQASVPAKAGIRPSQLREQPAIRKIIAVASGKGGVGKSTVAVNIALALRRCGLSTGLLDADIYGPSVPRMMGIQGQKPALGSASKLIPVSTYGLKVMSIGFMIGEASPLIWRGPMVQSAIRQFLEDVDWSDNGMPLDVLVVDMPPGTGDAQLTLAQKVPLAGAIIVSTPQDIALIDARRGIEMFRRTNVPIMGIVENMSYFNCPHCGSVSEIFGHGGARDEAEKLNVPFLGEIPLHAMIRTLSDAGTPVVAARPDSAESRAYTEIGNAVAHALFRKSAAA